MEGLKTQAHLKAAELKFMLKLLGCKDYRGKISQLSPSASMSAAERDHTCRSLAERGWVDYDSEVARFAIAPPGRTLLSLDNKSLLVTPDEYKVLRICKGSMTPGKLSKIPAKARQNMICGLAERGLIKITRMTIKEVWLTIKGKRFFLHDYCPDGAHAVVSATMLGNYVQFLRSGFAGWTVPDGLQVSALSDSLESADASILQKPDVQQPNMQKPDRRGLVQWIRKLDQDLGTGNSLPISHLRSHLQPPFTREELDDMLLALQQNNRLQLTALTHHGEYSDREVAAGITQAGGDRLFFITVC